VGWKGRCKMKKITGLFEGPVEKCEVAIAGISIFSMMVIEVLNAFGRKLYTPFPCCLESAESLMITSVFLGVGYVALREGHTQVTILTRWMRPRYRRLLDAAGYLFATATFGFLAFGACKIRIGVYRFPIWVFRVFFALGLILMTIQCVINIARFVRQAFDSNWEPEAE
jgi:TRAP-type C4-dicarboxylate transport system permease small subunit